MTSRFIKDGITLVSGNVWAQAIAFGAYLLLTRLYTPEDMGLYNIFYSYIEVLVIVSTCKYEGAVVLADSEREAAAVSRLALRLNTWISLLLLALLTAIHLLWPTSPLALAGTNFTFALLIPPMVFFCGTSRVYSALFNRSRTFSHIALSEVIGSTSGALSKVLMGLPALVGSWLHTLGLPLGTVLGKMASNINLRLKLRHTAPAFDITPGERRQAARKYRNFPCYTMPKDLVNSLSHNLPFLWLAAYADKAEVGLFALALTFTFRPINILYGAFERLLYVDIAEKVRARQSIKADILHFVKWLNLVALPVFIILFCFGEQLFGFLFGARWAGCGYYLRCLLPWVYVTLTSASLVFLSNVFARQRTEFGFYLVLLVLRVASVVVGIVSGNFRLAVLLFALSGTLVNAALLLWCLRLVALFETQTLKGENNAQ